MVLQDRRVGPHGDDGIGKELVRVDVAAIGRPPKPRRESRGGLSQPLLRRDALIRIEPE